MEDEQLVWNLGILALYMVLGPKFRYHSIQNNSDIPWENVKNQINDDELYSFMFDALRTNF